MLDRTSGRTAVGAARLLLLLLPFASGCASKHALMREPIPKEILDSPFIDVSLPPSEYIPIDPQSIVEAKKVQLHALDMTQPLPDKQTPLNVLAISGGGTHGAFDIGLLAGWNTAGTRPKFDVVTGISTGAFIATFAFLGPQYDAFLRESYLTAKAKDIYRSRPVWSILVSDAIASSQPLKNKIDEAITAEVLQDVAKEHLAGRRLYIGTTNLETHRLVIWDMGAIAASGRPDSLELYRHVTLASGSVPGFLPPVRIGVEVDGKEYKELHIDGGATTAVFVPQVATRGGPTNAYFRRGANIYVMCSGKLYTNSTSVKPRVFPVTANVISGLLHSVTRSDVNRIYHQALLNGADFHVISVPQETPLSRNSLAFNPKELRMLYDLGYALGESGKGWRDTPPGTEPSEQMIPRTGTTFTTGK